MENSWHVLIVDDDKDFAESTAELLEGQVLTTIATSAERAQEIVSKENVAMVLLDLRLGNVDGFDLIHSFRKNHPSIRVVVMTAHAEFESAVEALRRGADDYLRKPFYPEELLTILKRCFENIRLQEALRKSQEQLHQAQKMETIGKLAGGIAHDFNNLLTAIVGNAELGLQSVEPSHQSYDDFVEIKKAAVRASELTNQLLSLSRRQLLKKEVIDLNQTIDDQLKMLSRILPEDIELESTLDNCLPKVFADKGQIHQILMNLCTNARDAMPKGGSLRLETQVVPAERLESILEIPDLVESFVQLTVEDTGVGIDQALQDQIFEPFFTTKEVGQGTGLGLAVVFGIVRQHDGHIEVESEDGKGATFRILLPSMNGEPNELEDSIESAKGGNETILLVEDDEIVRKVGVRIIEGLGYKVISARDGCEAMEIFKKEKADIDLIMMDVVMPRVSGPETFKEMNKLDPNIPVLFVTGYDVESRLPDLELRFDRASIATLTKPYDNTAVRSILRGIAESLM